MAKSNNMKDLLKQRMSASQQVSEMEIGNRAYESLIDPLPVAASTIRELPVDKLRPFFTTDIGFHPYSPEKLRAFSKQLLEQGLLERIIVRSIPGSDEYEILAGHNRTAAWRMAGHDTIPAEVVVANDARAIIIATATNLLRRQELTIIERGKAYKAIAQIETLRFRTTECTGRNKLRDAVEMFMGNVLYDFKIVPCEAGCVIYLWPPPDYYDPIEFANSIIDLMTYIGAEIDRMKAELAAVTAAEQEMEVAA